jgi:hypothetical protein
VVVERTTITIMEAEPIMLLPPLQDLGMIHHPNNNHIIPLVMEDHHHGGHPLAMEEHPIIRTKDIIMVIHGRIYRLLLQWTRMEALDSKRRPILTRITTIRDLDQDLFHLSLTHHLYLLQWPEEEGRLQT